MDKNYIDTSRQAVSRLVSYADNNREKIAKTLINGLLLFVIFAIFGCFDFLTMTFKFDNLLKASFWTKVLMKAIAGSICAYNLGINFVWDRDVNKDQILKEQAIKYQRLLKLKDDKTFNYFVLEVFNKQEKIRAYVYSIDKKIYWLDKFSTNKSKLLYASEKEEDKPLKEKNKYCIKRKELEELKSKDYIDKNIDRLQIKYNAVNPLIFDRGLDGKPSADMTKTQGSIAHSKISKTSSGMLSMVLVSCFITIIGLSGDQEQFESQMVAFWHYLLGIAEDIGIIGWQVLRGLFASPKIISEELVEPLIGRNRVLTEYSDWCLTNNIEKSKSCLVYEKILESEVSQC